MNYEVRLTSKAERQLEAALIWWSENRSAEQAERWHAGFIKAMISLERNPERCQSARESPAMPIEVRELHFGLGRRPSHRVVFAIRPSHVIIYAIRHVAQADLTVDDL